MIFPREELLLWKARLFNQALMELGALVCQPRTPRCTAGPLQDGCQSLRQGIIDQRPVLSPRQKTVRIEMATGILVQEGRVLIQKRLSTGVWADLWEFPGGRLEPGETPEEALVREFREETELEISSLAPIKTVRHSYTIYRVILHGFFCSVKKVREPVLHAAQDFCWVVPSELARFAFPSGHKKLIDFLNQKQWFDRVLVL